MTDPMLPPGTNFCQCAACGLYCRNVRAFDAHQVGSAGNRRCVPTPDMASAGLQLDDSGYWRLPKRQTPDMG